MDLTSVRPELSNQILCPLCLLAFRREAIQDKSIGGLSIEHIVPSALGGRLQTLTCRRCNNKHGSPLDAPLIRMVQVQDWSEADGSKLKGKITVGEVELPMKISLGKEGNRNTIEILGGKQATIDTFREAVHAFETGDEVNLSFSLGYAELPARRALVRIAHLGMFSIFGYRFALSEAGAFSRRALTAGDLGMLRSLTPQISNVEVTNVENPLVITPIESVAYLILFRTDTLRRRYHGVILPSTELAEAKIPTTLLEVAAKLDGRQCQIPVPKSGMGS
ncbi:MAG TPA: HNH endonuclease [Bryobacteraceae bacterium]